MGAYLTWKASKGFLAFDVVTSETITKTSVSTDSPVETGANVSDHVRSELDRVTLEVFVTNAPIQGGNHVNPYSKRGDFEGITLAIPKYRQPFNSLSALINAGISALSNLIFGPPSPPRAVLLQFSEEFNAVQETWNVLDQLRQQATLISVIAPNWSSESMIIDSLSMPRTSIEGDGAKISISFKQIRIVETKQTLAPVPAEPRAKGVAKAGAAGGKPVTSPVEKSTMVSLFGGVLK